MTSTVARLRVVSAGPFVTIQDGGRFGRLRFGVPASGPMDRIAQAAANVSVGNAAAASAIEVSRGGVVFECSAGRVTLAVAGGEFAIDHAGRKDVGWRVLTVNAGERLAVRAGRSGSWAYVAFAGDLVAHEWLGSVSTHSMSGLGGGALTSGQQIVIEHARVDPTREGDIAPPDFARAAERVRVVMGPQNHHFGDEAIAAFLSSPYRLTDAFDRMGVRLSGPLLPLRDVLSIPSEPIVRGSIQVAGDGVPTVLLADHQTTGGYPKIATVLDADVDTFAQLRTGDVVEFDAVEPSAAIVVARSRAEQISDYLANTASPGRTITHRLRAENLISGVVADPEGPG